MSATVRIERHRLFPRRLHFDKLHAANAAADPRTIDGSRYQALRFDRPAANQRECVHNLLAPTHFDPTARPRIQSANLPDDELRILRPIDFRRLPRMLAGQGCPAVILFQFDSRSIGQLLEHLQHQRRTVDGQSIV